MTVVADRNFVNFVPLQMSSLYADEVGALGGIQIPPHLCGCPIHLHLNRQDQATQMPGTVTFVNRCGLIDVFSG